MLQLLPATTYRRERWKNGGGFTREILRFPAEGDWDWRASVAEVGSDGPFSAFPGCEREIVLLAGQGMDLDFEQGPTVRLAPPHGRHRFAGEATVSARLVEGPTLDFNLIWRRAAVQARLLHRPIVGSMLFFGEPGVDWLLYVLAGEVRTPAGRLAAGDAAYLGAGVGRTAIEGGGELLIARIERGPGPAAGG
ncbi:MAG: hypothetical protein KatS3mg127_1522 [Silanimonas sp.]|nr:MAG: hypothetical protein KatS3mg127_1522 [Silanimonas sp.]